MAQVITCARCDKVVLMTSGDGWVEKGWFRCACGYETRVSKAKSTNEYRLAVIPVQAHSTGILDTSDIRPQATLLMEDLSK